ncbi:Cof-type HAD-IIB family hydrolase [Lacticaseibacillus manihotivorans]|uniref:Cof-type HAD-IIB family hydrolase n=1 Tax=Lacticaseibacillus manihotivorans TaxID=88233 RepID=A0A5P8JV84_9LACO|nr:Cof-type HAD-IIB family hydrolase [Lacticaseibacillus manihotivorans]
MPKLIAVDMDGTFLNDEKTYDHDRFNKLYAKMQAQGTRFVVASGNQYYQLKTFFNQPEVLFLSENGAYCGTADTKLFASTFTTENARKVLDALLTIPELKLSICGVNSAYIRESEGQVWINDTRKYYTHLAIVDNFDQLPDDEILKFAMGCPPEKTNAIMAQIAQATKGLAVPTSSGHGDIDVIQPGINKATGLKRLGDSLGIDLSEMCAFGDGGNDLEMLQEVGLGVAMQNASPQVSAIADDHTLDNNHAGVLAYLEKIFN